ncbi:FecR family protein [Chitinophaga sp. HK235]|uniref:FecR family protein n=1 Tax=Chitinophaga sp. HK235 TaxID=2952571 RepID=UPI001BA9E249|nr:FecR domain-containing protein [Chitinophaga sp. HK235]
MLEENQLNRLIEKYLAGDATAGEEALLDEWFEQWHTPAPEAAGTYDRAFLREKIFSAVDARIKTSGRVIPIKRNRIIKWGMVASVVTAIVAGAGWWYKSGTQPRKQISRLMELHTNSGQLLKVVLTDSSVVWLNASSQLQYPERFTDNRTVYLQGEAWFDIHQDPLHPFIIESHGFRTKVLGTAFSIRSYAATGTYRVTVASGKVAVFKSADSSHIAYLTADQELRISGPEGTPQIRQVHAQIAAAWKDGSLSFEKDPLAEVVVSLQNRYGTSFLINSPRLKNIEISGRFDHKESLDDILKILSKVYGLHFKKQANGTFLIS